MQEGLRLELMRGPAVSGLNLDLPHLSNNTTHQDVPPDQILALREGNVFVAREWATICETACTRKSESSGPSDKLGPSKFPLTSRAHNLQGRQVSCLIFFSQTLMRGRVCCRLGQWTLAVGAKWLKLTSWAFLRMV